MKIPETLTNFQKWLAKNKVDFAAVTDILTVNYLTSFTFVSEGDAFLLVTPKKATCFTKEMYLIDIKKKCPFLSFKNSLDIKDLICLETKGNRIFDPYFSSYINGTALKQAGFKESPKMCSIIREVKTKEELKNIKRACEIAANSYEIFRKKLKAGMTEKQAAKLLEDIMSSLGGQGLAFETIMAFGPSTANPHHINSDRKLKQNEVVLTDFGCKYNGYCSDITRTFWFGKKKNAEFEKYYKAVVCAHNVAVKVLKAGKKASFIDKTAREYFEDNYKCSKYFLHTLGHSLGLNIHERPILSCKSEDTLKEGALTTIEPGLYFKGRFGIRYENTFLITKNGCKNLSCIGDKK